MFDKNSFFIDLVSNASMDIYPENSLSRFTNKLISPISLKGEWEVALNEIFYPLEFIPNTHTVSFALGCMTSRKRSLLTRIHQFEYVEGSDINLVLKTFNEKINEVFNSEITKKFIESSQPSFSASKDSHDKVDLKPGYVSKAISDVDIKKFVIYPEFKSQDFLNVLGFDLINYKTSLGRLNPDYNEIIRATNLPDNTLKTTLLFIYTDIIRHHPVGDTTSPLLRVAPLSKGSFDSVGHITFTNQYYYRLRCNHIETINIFLCDELGKQINFRNGRVFISLHFRKI